MLKRRRTKAGSSRRCGLHFQAFCIDHTCSQFMSIVAIVLLIFCISFVIRNKPFLNSVSVQFEPKYSVTRLLFPAACNYFL
jgi:hypothetical protein